MSEHALGNRQFIRLDVTKPGKCKIEVSGFTEQPSTELQTEIRVLNLSPSGACLCIDSESKLDLRRNDRVQLEIPVNEEALILNGRVKWSRKEVDGIKIGVNFESLNEDNGRKIRHYLYKIGMVRAKEMS